MDDIGMNLFKENRMKSVPSPGSFEIAPPPAAVSKPMPEKRDSVKTGDGDHGRARGSVFHDQSDYIIKFTKKWGRSYFSPSAKSFIAGQKGFSKNRTVPIFSIRRA
jgi:hypothetical protein